MRIIEQTLNCKPNFTFEIKPICCTALSCKQLVTNSWSRTDERFAVATILIGEDRNISSAKLALTDHNYLDYENTDEYIDSTKHLR